MGCSAFALVSPSASKESIRANLLIRKSGMNTLLYCLLVDYLKKRRH